MMGDPPLFPQKHYRKEDVMPKDWLRNALAEGIGIFALIFFGAGSIVMNAHTNGGVGLLGIAVAHAVALAIAISATMNISGGHINPAVTITMALLKRISLPMAGAYLVSQLLFATLAAFALNALMPAAAVDAAKLGTPLLSEGVSAGQGVAIEVILTFFLGVGIFGTAVHPKAPKTLAGFGIGLVLLFDILVAGPLTGASMNPARTLGPALVSGNWANHWVYWVGPVLGLALAGAVYEFVLGSREKAEAPAPRETAAPQRPATRSGRR